MLLPVAFVLLQAMPRLKLWAAPLGFAIMCVALSMSSFASNTSHLILSQGIGYGIGASLAYAPTIIFMDDWFVRRKGLAFGIMWVSGCSELVLLQLDRLMFLSGWNRAIWSDPSNCASMAIEHLRPSDCFARLVNSPCCPGWAPALLRPTSTSNLSHIPSPPPGFQVFAEFNVPDLRSR